MLTASSACSTAIADSKPATQPAELYPTATIASDHLKAKLYLPHPQRGYNVARRFDKSGMIARVETADGHTFFAPLSEPGKHRPQKSDAVIGTAEEFDMEHPPGYAEAGPGEPFVKIGVGVLQRKDEKKYWFPTDYKFVEVGTWDVTLGDDERSIVFTQTLDGPRGWAYRYTKTVTAAEDKPVITIDRTLENTGEKTINTTHYGHNFVVIDDRPAGPGYEVHFSFDAKPGEKFKAGDYATFESGTLVFNHPVARNKALWGMVEGFGDEAPTTVSIVNTKSRAAVDITTDRPLEKLVMYSLKPYVAAEPFVSLTVEPGKQVSWSTRYRFRTKIEAEPDE